MADKLVIQEVDYKRLEVQPVDKSEKKIRCNVLELKIVDYLFCAQYDPAVSDGSKPLDYMHSWLVKEQVIELRDYLNKWLEGQG